MSRRCGRMSRGKNRGQFHFNDAGGYSMVKRAHGNDLVDVAGELKGETERAYRFYDGGKETVWLPKSQCQWDEEEKVMSMPEWLAMEKGLL